MNGMSGIWDVGKILFYPQAGSRVCTGTGTPPCLRFYFHASEGVIREACAARCAMCQWVLVFVNHLDLMIVYNARLWLIPILRDTYRSNGLYELELSWTFFNVSALNVTRPSTEISKSIKHYSLYNFLSQPLWHCIYTTLRPCEIYNSEWSTPQWLKLD